MPGQTLGALHRRPEDPQGSRHGRSSHRPQTGSFLSKSGHKKNKNNICWLNPVCPVHRLALLPFALIIFLDFHPCQLVVPH